MATRYRDLAAPALIDTSPSQFETGGSRAAQTLADTFRQFSSQAIGVSNQLFAKEGAIKGEEAGASDNPKFKQGLMSLTAYGQAYNSAAGRGYMVRTQADVDEQAARLEASGASPEEFKAKMDAIMKGHLQEAPREVQGMVREAYMQRTGAGLARIAAAEAIARREQSRNDTSEGIDRMTDTIARLRSQDTPEAHAQADEEELKLQLFIEGARNDNTLSPTEAAAAHIAVQRQIVEQTVVARFERELKSPYGNPVKFIQNFKELNKQSEALSPDEERKLEDKLLSTLRDHNALLSLQDRALADEEESRVEAGDKYATSLLLSGQLTRRKLLDMTRSGDLKPATARTLMNELEIGNQKSDAETLTRTRITLLDHEPDDLLTKPGLSWEDKGKLIEELEKRKAEWPGTHAAREATARIDRALRIPPGANVLLLPPEQAKQRERALNQWYDAVDALPPEERQRAVIPEAEKIIEDVIRQNATAEVARKQRALEEYKTRMGDPGKMTAKGREAYDNEVKRRETQIREAELRAK